jgi:uncharacterized protein YjbJ (UPF0337 family)
MCERCGHPMRSTKQVDGQQSDRSHQQNETPIAGTTGSVRRFTMKTSTRDQAKGTMHQVKGKTKEAVGKVTRNTSLENQGRAENLGGKIQKKVGDVEQDLEEE